MAFIISRDRTGTFDQIKGKNMRGFFRDNQLHRIDVMGNAETIYFVREDDGAMIGINKLVSSNMSIVMEERKVAKIIYYNQPEGKMYPEQELGDAEKQLKGFEWQDRERPASKEDIFIKRGEGEPPD